MFYVDPTYSNTCFFKVGKWRVLLQGTVNRPNNKFFCKPLYIWFDPDCRKFLNCLMLILFYWSFFFVTLYLPHGAVSSNPGQNCHFFSTLQHPWHPHFWDSNMPLYMHNFYGQAESGGSLLKMDLQSPSHAYKRLASLKK